MSSTFHSSTVRTCSSSSSSSSYQRLTQQKPSSSCLSSTIVMRNSSCPTQLLLLPQQRQLQQQRQRRRTLVSLHGSAHPAGGRSTTFRSHNKQKTIRQRYKNKQQQHHHRLHPEGSSGSPTTIIPPPDPHSITNDELEHAIDTLYNWMKDKSNILALTGAGISTDSGIPDYRGHRGSYHHGHKPILHDQFMTSHYHRQRYWGRGLIGWRYFHERKPNSGHYALAQLEFLGKLGVNISSNSDNSDNVDRIDDDDDNDFVSILTQNVDVLHRKAGTPDRSVIELHGRTDELVCMECGHLHSRRAFHEDLENWNSDWLREAEKQKKKNRTIINADGDASVGYENYQDIYIPNCENCQVGFYKPNVVFFGDTVPSDRVQRAKQAVANIAQGGGLLVVGSSLAVHSAYRHVKYAHQHGIPIAILNVGPTRPELEHLQPLLKIEAPAGPVLQAVAARFLLLAEQEGQGHHQDDDDDDDEMEKGQQQQQ